MGKTIGRAILPLLVTVGLLWGGCLSCPQYFMVLAQSPKSCCDPTGECKQKHGHQQTRRSCNILQAAVNDEKVVDPSVHAAADFIAPPVRMLAPVTVPPVRGFPDAASDRGSPPDLNLLYSILRV